MNTHAERSQAGDEWEDAVADWLWLRGWLVQKFGQALFNGLMIEKLREYRLSNHGGKLLLRWLPDLLIARTAGASRVAFIDAKYSDRNHETGNQDVEVEALSGAMAAQQTWGIPVWFFFSDFTCIRADKLESINKTRMPGVGPHRTDFWLFRCSECIDVETVFSEAKVAAS